MSEKDEKNVLDDSDEQDEKNVLDDSDEQDETSLKGQEMSERRTSVSFNVNEKIIGLFLAIATIVFSVGGDWLLSGYKITELQSKCANLETRLTQEEITGHPDHEKRITKLETRSDSTDKVISEMGSKLDVAIAILERIERRSDGVKGN